MLPNSTGNSAGATWLNKTSSKNDMFTRLHEDPMLLIKQNEKRVSHFDFNLGNEISESNPNFPSLRYAELGKCP